MSDRDKTEILNPGRSGAATPNTDDAITRIAGKGDAKVGLLTITDGPGTGTALPLFSGQNDISRADTARVQLNFGDSTISRNTPVLLECDPRQKTFTLRDNSHPNPVTINGARLSGASALTNGDSITIGKTTLRFTTV
ncbi:MAG: FHA domain-containing protein [Hyphomicrobiaceae bacterium]